MAEGTLRVTEIASIMNASILLARAGFDPHYFGTLQPALDWLSQFGALESRQMITLIARLKQQLGQLPS